MSGQFNGIQKKIKDMSGNSCPYVYCHAYKLNLVLVDVSRKVEEVHDTVGLLEAVYAFQSSSTLSKYSIIKLTDTILDYSRCAKLIKSTKEQLINLRSEKIFINIYNEAVSVFQTSNIEPNNTLRPTREQRISLTLDNYLTYSTLGASTSRKEKQNMSSKDTENEFKRVFFQILDNMNSEMIYRFTQNNEILNYIHASDPKTNEFLNLDLNIEEPVSDWKIFILDNLTLSDLHQQISNYASAECSFSTMRRVKTYLRSTMKSSRLSNFTLLSIDFENSDKLLKDPTAVLEVFASMKNRRIQFKI
ncbi:Hypothetical protein CINCED_3A002385 [Cinara cedri]|uniref:HAT, C-terminal dimerisation domain n=1 Tax=Cinara cedri TaxID=506608 RepID=A0A5E4MKT2_9HEMI|nr:Hypothetical protein CINCED_3A002385 [Cinara cedri]